jgi:hypothetical protein
MRARYAERLPRYPPETTQMRKKLLVPQLFLYWGTRAVCAVWLGLCFEETYFPHLQGYGPLNWLIHSFIHSLTTVHSFFQSEFSTECDLVLLLSISSILSLTVSTSCLLLFDDDIFNCNWVDPRWQ